jgi:hypothetical protein
MHYRQWLLYLLETDGHLYEHFIHLIVAYMRFSNTMILLIREPHDRSRQRCKRNMPGTAVCTRGLSYLTSMS